MRVRLTNIVSIADGVECDATIINTVPFYPPGPPAELPVPPPFVPPVRPPVTPPPFVPPPPVAALPDGYDTDEGVALGMLLASMNKRGMTGVSVQGHGKEICAALNADWPGLNTYAHPQSDAVVWPGFGSLDVTIDGGKGGFYFRPDKQAPYDPALFKRLNG